MDTELLQAISIQLQRIAEALAPASQQMLGFGEAPKSQVWVFCNRKQGGVWYTLDSQNQPVNIEHPALTGRIRKLEFKETLRRNEKSHKLHCTIEADQLYILEGSATAVTRQLHWLKLGNEDCKAGSLNKHLEHQTI